MRTILLDTNAYTEFVKGDERILKEVLSSDLTYLSVIVLGEIYFGCYHGKKLQENLATLERFLQKPMIRLLDVTSESARIFGFINAQIHAAGTPIPVNDVWIAAQTQETDSVLITYDSHFLRIPGLRLWDQLSKN